MMKKPDAKKASGFCNGKKESITHDPLPCTALFTNGFYRPVNCVSSSLI